MDNQPEKNVNESANQEIDLFYYFSLLGKWLLKYIWHPIVELTRIALRRWYVFIAFILIGFGISFLRPVIMGKEYYAAAVYRCFAGSASDYVNKVEALGKEDPISKMKKLGLSKDQVKALRTIWPHYAFFQDANKTAYVIDYYNQYVHSSKATYVPDIFCVEIKTRDLDNLDIYNKALFEYLFHDEYMRSLNTERIKKSMSILEKHKEELASMILLRDERIMGPVGASINISIDSLGRFPANNNEVRFPYFHEIQWLNDQIIALEYNLSVDKEPLSIVTPLASRGKPINDWSLTWKKDVALCLLLGFVLVICYEFRKEIIAFATLKKN